VPSPSFFSPPEQLWIFQTERVRFAALFLSARYAFFFFYSSVIRRNSPFFLLDEHLASSSLCSGLPENLGDQSMLFLARPPFSFFLLRR